MAAMYRSLIRDAGRHLGLGALLLVLAILVGCQEQVTPVTAADIQANDDEVTVAAAARLVVYLTGARSSTGNYACALFDNSEDFGQRANPVFAENLAISEEASWQVREIESGELLPPGEYAIAVFHDENLNNKLDRHALGYPLEAYGFSNNARGKFGPPKYDAATFQLGEETVKLTISLK